MGVYQYTLRAETREIDGLTIGRYGFAYKHGWGNYPGANVRHIRRGEVQAEAAAYKNRLVRHFIVGEFSDIQNEPIPVYVTETVDDQFTETLGGIIAGHLIRKGRSLRFVPKEL